MSREKGKRAERQAAEAIRETLKRPARRSQQFMGMTDSSDVVVDGAKDLFVEVKMVEKLNVPAAVATAVEQAGDKVPIVLHRKSRQPWLMTVRFSDLPRLIDVVTKSQSAG